MANTFCFIDDLLAINDGGEFSRSYHEIYPPELELGRENDNISSASFLDLDIRIRQGKFSTSLFDKTDSFPFSIVRMPYASSNMPSTIFYSTISAEILRIARATTTLEDFLIAGKSILNRMHKQGAVISRTTKVISKTIGRHSDTFSHFNCNSTDMIKSLF